jgi:hypothetical protein
MGKRRTSEADLEVPSMTATVLELSAPHMAWPEGAGASVVVKKGRARRPAEKVESTGEAGAGSVQRRKRSTQPNTEAAPRRSPARSGGVKREREESGAHKPKTSPTAAEGGDGVDTASMGKRTSARNGRARGSVATRTPSAARAKDCREAERSAVAEDERRAGDPSQVQVLEPALGDEARSGCDPVFWTQLESSAQGIARSHGQDLLQVELGVEPVHLAGGDERGDGASAASMLVAAVEEPILPSFDDPAQGSLACVVYEWGSPR